MEKIKSFPTDPWPGDLVRIALRRNTNDSFFNEIPDGFLEFLSRNNGPTYISSLVLAQMLEPFFEHKAHFNKLIRPFDEFMRAIFNVKHCMGSAEYFQLKGAKLDAFRSAHRIKDKNSDEQYLSIQERLHLYAEIVNSKVRENETDSMLIRAVIFFKMDKIASEIKTLEFTELHDMEYWAPEKLEFAEASVLLTIQSFSFKLRTMSFQQKKQYFVKLIFGNSTDHYLVPYFEREFEKNFAKLDSERPNDCREVYLNFAMRVESCSVLVDYFKEMFLKNTSYAKTITNKDLKPLIRSIRFRPFVDDKYLFTSEVVNAINFAHRIKNDGKKFSNKGKLIEIDSGNGIYNMMNMEELDDVLKMEGLKRDDFKIFETFIEQEYRNDVELIQSPANTLSVFAGRAFHDIFLIILAESISFSMISVEDFKHFRYFVEDLKKFFLPLKKNLYTFDYQIFLKFVEDAKKRLAPHYKSGSCNTEINLNDRVTVKELKKIIENDCQYSKKFKHFYSIYDTFFFENIPVTYNEGSMKVDPALVRAFYAENPEIAELVHIQNACYMYTDCTMSCVPGYVKNKPKRFECKELRTSCQCYPSDIPLPGAAPVPDLSMKGRAVEKEKGNEELIGMKRGFLNSGNKKKEEKETVESSPTKRNLSPLEEAQNKLEIEKKQRMENLAKFQTEAAKLKKRIKEVEDEKKKLAEQLKEALAVVDKNSKLQKKMEQDALRIAQENKRAEIANAGLQSYLEDCSKKAFESRKVRMAMAEKSTAERRRKQEEDCLIRELYESIERVESEKKKVEEEKLAVEIENSKKLKELEEELRIAKCHDKNDQLLELGNFLKFLDENNFVMEAKIQLESSVESFGDAEELDSAVSRVRNFAEGLKFLHAAVLENVLEIVKNPDSEDLQLKELSSFLEPFSKETISKIEENLKRTSNRNFEI